MFVSITISNRTMKKISIPMLALVAFYSCKSDSDAITEKSANLIGVYQHVDTQSSADFVTTHTLTVTKSDLTRDKISSEFVHVKLLEEVDYVGTANDDKNSSKWFEARDVEIFEANRLDFRQPGVDNLGNRMTVGIEGKISSSKLPAAMYLVYPDEKPIEYVVDFGKK